QKDDESPNSTSWPTAESVILQRVSSTSIHPSLAHLRAENTESKTVPDDKENGASESAQTGGVAPEDPVQGDSLTVSGIINSLRESRGASQDHPGAGSSGPKDQASQKGTGAGSAQGEYHIPYCLFNTHSLVSRLVDVGFTRDQATVIMTLVKYKVYETIERLRANMLTKSDLENDAYLFRAALQELRTETQMIRKNDQAILESQAAAIHRDIESLAQRLTDEIANLRSDIQIELNNHKHDTSHKMKNLDMELHTLASRYQVVMGEMKTDIETIRLESIRRGLLAAVVTTLALLTIIWGPELIEKLNLRRRLKGQRTDITSNDEQAAKGADLQPPRIPELPPSATAGRNGYVDPSRAAVYGTGAADGRRVLPGVSQPPYGVDRGQPYLPADSTYGQSDRGQRYRDHSHLHISYDPTISASEGHFGTQQAPAGSATDNYDDWFDAFFYPPQTIAERRSRSGASASLIDSDPTFDSAHLRSRDEQLLNDANRASNRTPGDADSSAGERAAHIPINFTDINSRPEED
ncbi:hypothetical protein IWW54_001049, partial [Coemansia sp. RSA 2705]